MSEPGQPSRFFDDIYPDGLRVHGKLESHSERCKACGTYLIKGEKLYCDDCN